jgi:tetratricopeptide (TPR) repeat protein
MQNAEMTPVNVAAAEADNSQPVASVNPAIAMIDEGNALEEQGRMPEAMERYEAAIKTDPQCARAYLNRGNVLLAGARFDDARNA